MDQGLRAIRWNFKSRSGTVSDTSLQFLERAGSLRFLHKLENRQAECSNAHEAFHFKIRVVKKS